ncbi:thiol-disulfide oxidoreductase DCC family protein [Rhodoplanes sp. SY1]|uniref:thiol-disulfide oxidoreductase DCC family protein n=1 Tax=Rhodoplanes sp. SY1 TaxID=3166646 RepID=UPI0038B4B71B
MQPETSKTTVFFDGSCQLCRAEIEHYGRQVGSETLCFIDVSRASDSLPPGLSREQAMARFHVLSCDGRLISGAAAFATIWSVLPRWRWASRVAASPTALTALELGYRLFLPIRPLMSRLVGRLHGANRSNARAARP